MGNFLIIDPNTKYAAKLYAALTNNARNANNSVLDISQNSDLATVSRDINKRVKAKSDTTILVNVESKLKNGFHQDQKIVELAFWLRCRFKLKNTIVFYGAQSINKLLKTRPENLILLSPGCYHLRLPIDKNQINKITSFETAQDTASLKPYLRSKINLGGARHRYANYAGMNLMANIAVDVHGAKDINKILDNKGGKFAEFYDFRNSLTYHILGTYFDLEKLNSIDDAKKDSLKIDSRLARNKRVLLIDDLANEGWAHILSKIIYGEINDSRLFSINTHTKEDGKRQFDLKKLVKALLSEIRNHKPHLVLLDLRLNDDEETSATLEQLGGFQLLKLIKSHPDFKGVPVIMFTATTNAENVKELLNAGAEAVWTKPGIDEGLSPERIIQRYAQLIALINNAFNPNYVLLNQFNDNTDRTFNINSLDFEAVRNLLLKKLDLIKYRLKLYTNDELFNLTPEPYRSVDAIYVDANVLLSNNYEELISSLYKLAGLTAHSQFRYKYYERESQSPFPKAVMRQSPFPKVVIMNSVYDEIIKFAKIADYRRRRRSGGGKKNDLLYLRAMMSMLIVKQMFTDKLARTEFSKDSFIPECELVNPKENVYADGYILDEVADLLIISSKKVTYCDDTRIIFLTGDNKLQSKLKKFEDGSKGNLIMKSREEFVADMPQVVI